MVHERSTEILKESYKSAVFVLQALSYLRSGQYSKRHDELLALLHHTNYTDYMIMQAANMLKTVDQPISTQAFDDLSDRLFVWAASVIKKEKAEISKVDG